MKILFRADSSSSLGLGHIMRDLVLAKQYNNDTIFFACQKLLGNIIDRIPYEVKILKSNDINELINLIHFLQTDLLVIDHYGIDYKDEKAIKKATNVKILSFDDTYEKHYCDILLNHNISANPKKYINLVPKNCELRCGNKYTLIRDEFIKEKNIQRKKVYDIFVAMGGTDYSNINIPILKTLTDSLDICLITTTANSNLKELKKYVITRTNISLHIDSNKVAKLINQSRLAIISSSVIVHEILFMNLPFIAIKTADNQNDIYEYLKKENHLTLEKFSKEELNKKIATLLNTKNVI